VRGLSTAAGKAIDALPQTRLLGEGYTSDRCEFARERCGKRLNDPLWIDAAARSDLIDQRVAQNNGSGISRHIWDYFTQAQHGDPEVGKPSGIQENL
jgi:hypothetical protein